MYQQPSLDYCDPEQNLKLWWFSGKFWLVTRFVFIPTTFKLIYGRFICDGQRYQIWLYEGAWCLFLFCFLGQSEAIRSCWWAGQTSRPNRWLTTNFLLFLCNCHFHLTHYLCSIKLEDLRAPLDAVTESWSPLSNILNYFSYCQITSLTWVDRALFPTIFIFFYWINLPICKVSYNDIWKISSKFPHLRRCNQQICGN